MTGVPESFLVDPEGRIALIRRGPVDAEYLQRVRRAADRAAERDSMRRAAAARRGRAARLAPAAGAQSRGPRCPTSRTR